MAEVTDVDIVLGIPTGGSGTVPTLSKTNTLLGAVTEGAPATDTASSGVNGRLQRIAQRLTTLTGGFSGIAAVRSTALEGSHVLMTGACNLYGISVTIGAVSGYVMIFDATSAPADGAVTPVKSWPVGSDSVNGFLGVDFGSAPLALALGCVAVFSSTGPLTKTVSNTAFFSAQVR